MNTPQIIQTENKKKKTVAQINSIYKKVLSFMNGSGRNPKYPLGFLLTMTILFFSVYPACSQEMRLNKPGYFEARGLNIFVFSEKFNGAFFDEKHAGIEMIHSGERVATDGAVRLRPTPEQWDAVPKVVNRVVDTLQNRIEVTLSYEKYNFNPKIVVTAKQQGVWIDVYIDKPLPEKLIGHAGFNLEFLPTTYFRKMYLMDNSPHIIPLYPAGPMIAKPDSEKIPQFNGFSTFDGRGRHVYTDPLPMATGSALTLAPSDPERRVKIESTEGKLSLYDGRNTAQNGWFVVRSTIPANKTGKVVEWHLTASTVKNWIRKPVIQFSQVGYNPAQEKKAVIELDQHDNALKTASLYRISPEGAPEKVFTAPITKWGRLFRYNYVTFDFSSVTQNGIYFIKYGNQQSNVFPIATNVYDNVWHQTLDVWFPVQMDHMYVRDGYKVWHGAPFLDDARQAPVNNNHFDNHGMGSSTDTKYKPGQHIPGLNVGGWFDAGDYDIEEGSQCEAISALAATWEMFKPKLDQTYINQKTRYVDIHDPDGSPDILQQIEHGVLLQLAEQKAFGRAIGAISEAHLYQYDQLGDPAQVTDNKIYTPRLKPYQVEGDSSGTTDDRWAFTNDAPGMNYNSIAALAAAGRAFRGYNDSLSKVCLDVAEQSWARQQKDTVGSGNRRFRFAQYAEMPADLQLFISTKNTQYADRFKKFIWTALDGSVDRNITLAMLAIPYFGSDYSKKLEPYVRKLKEHDDALLQKNPYGVPISTGGWGGSGGVVNWAITNYYAHKAFPKIVGSQYAVRGIGYLFGCHPYSNTSFVSSVGVHSKDRFYSNNRADLSFIAGGVVPGILVLNPDFPENMDAWPFLWGENESVMGLTGQYVFLSNAVNDLFRNSSE